ncbi:MAG TPA: GNAT family N-acetyltransferase [Solirubrobacteraceae bacterium]|nr:GNAT family N-acetyltransferase [Solirubrobacteraceae bacterium]
MPPREGPSIALVAAEDLEDLLGLMRAYCDFYETSPSDSELLELSRALIADPELEGMQLMARDERGGALAFATVFWSWDTTEARRIGIMNDLYVAPAGRATGLADELIRACTECCRRRGAARLEWQTAPANARARAVYERVGAVREPWLTYTIPAG